MTQRNALAFDLGETWGIELVCHEADGVTPLPLAGASAELRVAGRGELLLTVGQGSGAEIVDADAGLVRFRVSPGQQSSLYAGVLTYTARVTLADGRVSDQAHGSLTLRATEFSAFA